MQFLWNFSGGPYFLFQKQLKRSSTLGHFNEAAARELTESWS